MRGVCVLFGLAFFIARAAEAREEAAIALLRTFTKHSASSRALAFTCWTDMHLTLQKEMFLHGISMQIILPEASVEDPLESIRRMQFGSVVLFLDLECGGAIHVMEQAIERRLLGPLRYWLLLEASSKTLADANFHFPLDSRVTVARKMGNTSAFQLLEIYSVKDNVVLSTPKIWREGNEIPHFGLRTNLRGITISAGIVKIDDNWSNYESLKNRHLDTWSKLHYALGKLLASRLNFTMKIVFSETWGYRVGNHFNGQVAQLANGEVDLGVSGIALKASRLDVIEYTAETGPFRPMFIYREPALAAVSNVYVRPFSGVVWLLYGVAVLLLSTLIVASQRLLASKHATPWKDVPLLAISVVCEEGCPNPPEYISSRILLMFMLVLSVFHMTSYSACIVSLLQSPGSTIDSLSSLINSPLKIGLVDSPYNVNYGNETNDKTVRSFYRDRIYSQPHHKVFMSVEECVANVRKGMFACHIDATAYKLVADSFLEAEKCGLKEIAMFPWQAATLPIAKNSPYRELIIQNLRWMRETGLVSREWRRWIWSKPECSGKDSSFGQVSLAEFKPAIFILSFGVIAAIVLLVVELLAAMAPLSIYTIPIVMSSLDCPVVVIDGSFASHLSTLVKDPVDGDPLWSASFLVKAPNAVIKVHYDYLTAGANIITTNTYQASATGFRKHLGLNDDESTQLIKKAVDLARTAIDLFTNDHTGCDKPLIAGSVGPYGAALNDGSEYTGSYIEGITMEELKDWHRPRIKALVESGVDLLAFETIPAQVEGEVLIDLIKEYPQQKAWLSFSCKDEKHTSKGELFSDAIQSCLTHNTGQLVAIGTNCVNPKFVTPLLKSVGKCELPFIVYPNSGEVYNSVTGWSGERNNKDIDSYVHQWLNMGVRFIGSCCRTYPKCIANICKEVSSWKNKCSC